MLQPLWDVLESSLFQFRIRRAVASIGVIIVTQLLFFGAVLALLLNLQGLAPSPENGPALASGIGWCIVLIGVAAAVATVLCLLVWTMLGYLVTKPLSSIDAIFAPFAKGDINLSQDIKELPYPELKNISIGYNLFLAGIRQIIDDMRKSGVRIAIGSAHVQKAVDMVVQKTGTQKELSAQVSVASADGNAAIREISESTHYVSENTGTNLSKVRTSYDELQNVAQKVDSINRIVASFGDTIDELNRSSAGIMDIIAVINDMSDQTNLLSLNATIEAARAGEHGKGFAVVAEEVRSLAKQIKPATEDISNKINTMISTVTKTKEESNTIIDASIEVNSIIKDTAGNFKAMMSDLEETNEQLLKVAAAVEELSLTNSEVTETVGVINSLSSEIFTEMETSSRNIHGFAEVTETMQETVAQHRTGEGMLDKIITLVEQRRDYIQDVLYKLHEKGVNVFDQNYRPIPNTNPQKFTTAFTEPLARELQSYLDRILKEIPGCIYIIPVDRKGYLPVHHSHFSLPMTGNYDVDLVKSRHMRFFFSSQTDIRRATNIKPMLLQTYMRDTGEVLNDLSMPITLDGRHWGGLIVGIKPEVLTE